MGPVAAASGRHESNRAAHPGLVLDRDRETPAPHLETRFSSSQSGGRDGATAFESKSRLAFA